MHQKIYINTINTKRKKFFAEQGGFQNYATWRTEVRE